MQSSFILWHRTLAQIISVLIYMFTLSGSITKKTGNTMDCDFEPDVCLWQHVRGNNLYWRLRQGTTPSGGTGPGNDHTFGNRTGTPSMLLCDNQSILSCCVPVTSSVLSKVLLMITVFSIWLGISRY